MTLFNKMARRTVIACGAIAVAIAGALLAQWLPIPVDPWFAGAECFAMMFTVSVAACAVHSPNYRESVPLAASVVVAAASLCGFVFGAFIDNWTALAMGCIITGCFWTSMFILV